MRSWLCRGSRTRPSGAQATLNKLKSAAGFLKGSSGDDGLDAVLGEIELRVEVEIAKMAAR
jgi:Class II flagellar assembly regulator